MKKTLKLTLMAAALALSACATTPAAPPAIRLILVGDSTLASHNGYGDALCARLIKPQVRCINLAKNGRSSGSYRAEGLWNHVLSLLADKSADETSYVLIEFGHNDQPGKPGRSTNLKTEFPANLARYVEEVRSAGGTPVLATPLTRRSFRDGLLLNDLQPWADATKAVAARLQVPLIDLLAASGAAVQAMGSAEADTLAVEPPPKTAAPVTDLNQVERVTNAKSAFDHTHVGPKGANFFAAIVERLMRVSVPSLVPYFK